MIPTLAQIKQYITIIIVLIVLGVVIYLGYKEIQQLKQINSELKLNINQNFKALNDSLRMLMDEQGRKIYLQTAFINDLSKNQSKILAQQGIQLKSLQEVSIKLDDIVMVIDSGQTEVSDSMITRSFYKDTSFVTVEGLTSVNLRNDNLSNTKLRLSSKDIPIEVSVGISEDGTYIGIVKPLISGISLKSLKTTLDPSLINKFSQKPLTLFDLLKIGGLLGMSSQYNLNLEKSNIVWGLDIEYSGYGVWYLKTNPGNIIGLRVSKSINEVF